MSAMLMVPLSASTTAFRFLQVQRCPHVIFLIPSYPDICSDMVSACAALSLLSCQEIGLFLLLTLTPQR